MLLQNGLDVLRVWDLQKGDQEGRRLSKKGDKMVGRHLPFTSCVLIGTREAIQCIFWTLSNGYSSGQGLVECFLNVPQDVWPYCSCHAAQKRNGKQGELIENIQPNPSHDLMNNPVSPFQESFWGIFWEIFLAMFSSY